MSEGTADRPTHAPRDATMIEHLVVTGNTIRALVELRALLDETGFWRQPEPEAFVRNVYLTSVNRFAERGVSEAELKISLHA